MISKSGSELLKAAAETLVADGAGDIAAAGEAAEAKKACLEKITVLRTGLRETAEATTRPAAYPAELADRLEVAAADAIAAAEAAAAFTAATRKTSAEDAEDLADAADGLAEVAEELAEMASNWAKDLPDRRRRKKRLKAITDYIAVFRRTEHL